MLFLRYPMFHMKELASRLVHSSSFVNSIKQSPLFELRQKTGLAYSLCREALNKHSNDVKEAENWLKAQALAHGLQKAARVGSRSAREGLVGLAVDKNHKSIFVIEVNCETDFVAKNQIFRDSIVELTEQFALIQNTCEEVPPDAEFMKELCPSSEQLSRLNNFITPLITRLGENIRINRASHFKVVGDDLTAYGGIHAQAGHKVSDNLVIHAGKYGAMVILKDLEGRQKIGSLSSFGNLLCRHVIGFSPSYIELPEAIRKHLEDEEKKKAENMVEETKEEMMDSEFEEIHRTQDDWPSIMDQTLIMSDGIVIRDYCKNNGFSIVHFTRFERGLPSISSA